MNGRPRPLLAVLYAGYCLLVVAVVAALDLPVRVERLAPTARPVPYRLDETFLKAERYDPPVTLRRRPSYEVADAIALGQVPSLNSVDRKALFHDPGFREETAVWIPDERYERDFAFSVRRDRARLFLFGDSLIVSYDFKSLPYVLNEEHGIPTFRRTFGSPGAMETVYAFVNETPAELLEGRTVMVEISEGSGVWVNSQVNGAPVGRTLRKWGGLLLYHATSAFRAGDLFRKPAPAPSLLPTAARLDSWMTPAGREVRPDSAHFNPVIFTYKGVGRALGFFDRDLALLSWDPPYFEGRTPVVSLENWLRRIARRGREKGADVAVLYVPTKLSAWWPVVGPILDYDRLYRFVSPNKRFNRTIRSPESLATVLPRTVDLWRETLSDFCHGEGIGFIDLAVPYREAIVLGGNVFREFDTHWNEEGIRIAAAQVSQHVGRKEIPR
jgi:hypothetical protein